MKPKDYLLLIAFILILSASFLGGYKFYGYKNRCPEIQRDTVWVRDTVIHTIPNDVHHYHDSLITVIHYDTIPADVDTAQILAAYFDVKEYARTWKDTLLKVELTDWISQNRILDTRMTYQILRPQTVITNVTNDIRYTKYIYLGADVPLKDIKYFNVDLIFAAPGWYAGAGYNIKLQSLSLKAGVRLFKFE